MYKSNNLKQMKTSQEGGGTDSYITLILAVAQEQTRTPCEIRKAKFRPPLWGCKFHEIVGNNEYYNEQGTQDNTDGDCWTIHKFFSSVIGWEICLYLTVRLNIRGTIFTSRRPVSLLHASVTREGECRRPLTSFATELTRDTFTQRWCPFTSIISTAFPSQSIIN
jgi:hypothetical protein